MRRLAPPPRLTLADWADRYRVLSSESSAEPGRWNTSRAEYQRGIMDAISDPRIERVVLMTSARVGKTQIINNLVGYHVDQDPAPILVVLPTTQAAEDWSKDELGPMLRDGPTLRRKVKAPRSRDAANTTLHKLFPGGKLHIVGANAPTGLAAKTIRVVCCDEVDRYPASAGAEGDPVSLAIKRTTTYWNRKIVLASTPTIAGVSRIEAAWLQSDQRRYFIPCPHCGEMQALAWARVRWKADDPATALYHCIGCGVGLTDTERWAAVRRGQWRATAEGRGAAGFHLSELYSPWRRLAETVGDFLGAKGKTEEEKVWRNTALGEPWQEAADAPDQERLVARREARPPRIIPPGGLFLTGTADVQGDRIEWDIWAWGEGFTAWLVDSGIIEGSPHQPATWQALRAISEGQYRDSWGRAWPIDAFGVDAGYVSQEVYRWVHGHPDRDRIFALDGRGDPRDPPLGSPKRIDVDFQGKKLATLALWPVGTHGLKLAHYAALRRTIAGPDDDGAWPAGAMRLPDWVQPDYCAQLVSEVLETIRPRGGGVARLQWRRLPNLRNERLDTAVYGRALAHHLTNSLTVSDWDALRERRGAPPPEKPKPPPAQPNAAQPGRRWIEPRDDWF